METRNILKKISMRRLQKGYTYENIAHDLEITPAASRKIETGETKLTVERLFKIAEILDSSIVDFLEIPNNIFNQQNHDSENVFQQKVENFYQDNKEVYQALLISKDEQINLLKEKIFFLEKNFNVHG